MSETVNNNLKQLYEIARASVIKAQHTVCNAVNSAMVTAYWEIGEQIYKACGGNDRAEYGKSLIRYISENLTKEFYE